MTDTPTAERDVVERLRKLEADLVALASAKVIKGKFAAEMVETAISAKAEIRHHRLQIDGLAAENARLRAELEQVREALLYAKICMEAQQEISQPELGGFAYPDSPLGKVRAALSSSPGESAALSASPSPEDNP